MPIERTLSIIKPDAVAQNIIGKIYTRLEANGFTIVAARMLHMTEAQAKEFYVVHSERHFFTSLIQFMTSGPVMVQVLEGDNAITRYRELMGATLPTNALPGTLRYDFARDGHTHENAVHGSDSAENASIEIKIFFHEHEICQRTR